MVTEHCFEQALSYMKCSQYLLILLETLPAVLGVLVDGRTLRFPIVQELAEDHRANNG